MSLGPCTVGHLPGRCHGALTGITALRAAGRRLLLTFNSQSGPWQVGSVSPCPRITHPGPAGRAWRPDAGRWTCSATQRACGRFERVRGANRHKTRGAWLQGVHIRPRRAIAGRGRSKRCCNTSPTPLLLPWRGAPARTCARAHSCPGCSRRFGAPCPRLREGEERQSTQVHLSIQQPPQAGKPKQPLGRQHGDAWAPAPERSHASTHAWGRAWPRP
jgi:hypothetical protein